MLTGIATMAHINREWTVDEGYHMVFALASSTLLIFINLVFIFTVIKSRMSTALKYVVSIGGALIITLVISILSGWLQHIIYDNPAFSITSGVAITRDLIVTLSAILIALLIAGISRRLDLRLEKEKLQNENLIVRYEALESQMDPHFLFNSLNTLSGLIGTDDESAQLYLQRLASTYRYIMQGKRIVTLEEELNFVDSYCEMMRIRFGKNLRFERHIDDQLLHHHIVPISIQLLIENALKHNVISERYPLKIMLETTAHNTFRVSNTMRPKQDDSGSTGLGLANLAKRYQLLCKQDISISAADNTFSVEVPLISPSAAKTLLIQN